MRVYCYHYSILLRLRLQHAVPKAGLKPSKGCDNFPGNLQKRSSEELGHRVIVIRLKRLNIPVEIVAVASSDLDDLNNLLRDTGLTFLISVPYRGRCLW